VALLVALPLELPKRKGAFELRRSVVPVEIVDGLSEVAGAPIIGSKGDQWGRAADSSDSVSGSWESACNLLMQHVRFFP